MERLSAWGLTPPATPACTLSKTWEPAGCLFKFTVFWSWSGASSRLSLSIEKVPGWKKLLTNCLNFYSGEQLFASYSRVTSSSAFQSSLVGTRWVGASPMELCYTKTFSRWCLRPSFSSCPFGSLYSLVASKRDSKRNYISKSTELCTLSLTYPSASSKAIKDEAPSSSTYYSLFVALYSP